MLKLSHSCQLTILYNYYNIILQYWDIFKRRKKPNGRKSWHNLKNWIKFVVICTFCGNPLSHSSSKCAFGQTMGNWNISLVEYKGKILKVKLQVIRSIVSIGNPQFNYFWEELICETNIVGILTKRFLFCIVLSSISLLVHPLV